MLLLEEIWKAKYQRKVKWSKIALYDKYYHNSPPPAPSTLKQYSLDQQKFPSPIFLDGGGGEVEGAIYIPHMLLVWGLKT